MRHGELLAKQQKKRIETNWFLRDFSWSEVPLEITSIRAKSGGSFVSLLQTHWVDDFPL